MHAHETTAAAGSPTASAREWWEQRYAERDGIWSGRVNAVLADVAAELPPAPGDRARRALDLGCGEGGDVVWLAEQGWDALGIDLSVTAIERGSRASVAAGVEEQTAFVAADLATWATAARFDLVTASFLQSWPVEIPRAEILRRAAGFVAVGGHLLVTAHAAPPHDDLPVRTAGVPVPDARRGPDGAAARRHLGRHRRRAPAAHGEHTRRRPAPGRRQRGAGPPFARVASER